MNFRRRGDRHNLASIRRTKCSPAPVRTIAGPATIAILPFAVRARRNSSTQFANDGRFWFVGINDRVDELKDISVRGRTLHRHDANPLMTDHNFVAFADVEKLDRPGGFFFSINRNRAVHHRGPHFDFLAVESNERLLIGRHVEIARENSVRRRAWPVATFARSTTSAPCWRRRRISSSSASLVSAETSIRAKLWSARLSADLDLADLEIRAMGQDLIQHLRQNERINNMTAQLDRFRKHLQNLADQSDRASCARKPAAQFPICVVQFLFRSWKNRARADLHRVARRISLWDRF